MLREVDEQCAKEGISYSEKLKKFAQALDQTREVSIQVCNFHLTQKVRSAQDEHFSRLCDRIGYNTLTLADFEFIKKRDIPCVDEDDPENFKQGKV